MGKILQPYNLLLATAVALWLVSFLIQGTLSYQIYDTMILVSASQYLKVFSFFMLFCATGYKFLRKIFYFSRLIWLHIALSLTLLAIVYSYGYEFNRSLRLIEMANKGSVSYPDQYNRPIHLLLLAFIIIQTLPLINMLIRLLKRRKNALAKT